MSRKWNDFAIASSRRTLLLAFQTLLVVAATRPCVAGAQPLYWGGGSTDIAANTPLPVDAALLTGTWDTTTKNWASSPKPGAYGAFANGADVQLGYYTNKADALITLGENLQISSLTACMSLALDYNRYFGLTATSPRTLTPVGTNFVVNSVSSDMTRRITLFSNVSLAGSVPLEKTGNGGFQVSSDSSAYTGRVRCSGGYFNVDGAGSLKGVPRFDLAGRVTSAVASGYGGDFSMGNLTPTLNAGANDKFADSALFVLNRGSLDCRASSTSTETIGRVDVETWGVLGAGQGTLGGTLTLSDATAGLTRGSAGLGMVMVPVDAAGTPYNNIRVPNGLPTDVLLPWIAAGRGGFMYVDGADNNTLKRVALSEAATDVTTWTSLYGSTSNVRVGNSTSVALTGALGGNLTLQSLGFFNTGATTLNLGSGNTLTLASGGIAFHPNAYGANQTITNGTLASGTDKLYLHTSDSRSDARLVLYSPIIGTGMDVVKGGIAGVEFKGTTSNTYGGKTIVNSGHLTLNKSAGAIAVPGPLVVRNSGSVSANANNISPTSNVTIESGGLIYAWNQTYGGVLTLAGGTMLFPNQTITLNKSDTPGLVFNGGWINHSSSHPGGINLQTDVRYESTATTQARFERLNWINNTVSYNIELDGGNRVFDIADSATLPDGVPEMVVDTAIVAGSPAGGALTKTGAGILQLTYTNSYAGGSTVNGGTLRVSKITAPAQTGLCAYTMQIPNVVTFTEPVARNMVLGQSITGTTISANRTVVRVLNDYEIMTSGGHVNGFSTNIAVAAMSRTGNLGTGPATVNDTGTLVIDSGISLANAVTVNAGGTIVASGAGLGSLAVDGGTVSVDLDAGALAMTGTLSLGGATLAVDSLPGDAPVTILSAAGGVTGKFTTIPDKVSVQYFPTYVTVNRLKGFLVVIR